MLVDDLIYVAILVRKKWCLRGVPQQHWKKSFQTFPDLLIRRYDLGWWQELLQKYSLLVHNAILHAQLNNRTDYCDVNFSSRFYRYLCLCARSSVQMDISCTSWSLTICVYPSRRVSDEVFDESFCEFFIPTEDCASAAKLTGLGNTRKLFKMESFRGPQQAWFHVVHSTVKFEHKKNKKTFDKRNGESDRRGDRSSSFIVNKSRISVQLQLQLNSLRKWVVCLEAWIWQVMVWAIITWETSTMVPHCLARHRTESFTYMSD